MAAIANLDGFLGLNITNLCRATVIPRIGLRVYLHKNAWKQLVAGQSTMEARFNDQFPFTHDLRKLYYFFSGDLLGANAIN